MNTLRVLIVMPLATSLGGGELMLRQLLRHGRNQGVEWMVVYLRDGPMVAETRALGIEAQVVPSGRFRDLFTRAGAVRKVAAIARQFRADLILGWMVAGELTAGPAAMLAGLPNVWYQVGTPRPDWLDRTATLFPARGVIVLSRGGAAAQSRVWPARKQWLVYPGVSLDAFNPDGLAAPVTLRAKFGLPTTGPLIGIVGRLQRWKGMDVFLDAIPAILVRYPDVHAVIIGGPHETEPRYPAELQARVQTLGISRAVTFAGFQSNVPEWMQAMDIVVHASDHEPFGIVVIEAMALGKPVVAGAEGGPSETITPGVDGLLSPFGDAAALATTVLRYLDDPSFAVQVGAAARKRAQQFDDRRYAANVIAALQESVARRAVT